MHYVCTSKYKLFFNRYFVHVFVGKKYHTITKIKVQFKMQCLWKSVFEKQNCILLSEHDECVTNQHNCDENALCFNTVGGHNCVCKPGYTGNGTTCKGKDFSANTSSIRDDAIRLSFPPPFFITVTYLLGTSHSHWELQSVAHVLPLGLHQCLSGQLFINSDLMFHHLNCSDFSPVFLSSRP